MRAGAVTLALMALVRLVMIFNPLGIRFEVFDNRESYGAIAAEAGRRPVVFRHGYAVAAKYIFYTGGEAYCQPNIRYRTHQWQFRDDDDRFTGREVLVECRRRPRPIRRAASGPCGWPTAAASRGSWIPRSTPCAASRSQLTGCPGGLPRAIRCTWRCAWRILSLCRRGGRQRAAVDALEARTLPCRGVRAAAAPFTLPAAGATACDVRFVVPQQLAGERFDVGFALRREGYTNWYNGKALPVEVAPLR